VGNRHPFVPRCLTMALVLLGVARGGASLASQDAPGDPSLARQLAELRRMFPVLDPKLGLHVVTNDFVLQAVCRHGVLASLHVAPKYSYRAAHPEWREPRSRQFLPAGAYADLMKRLDSVRPLGRVIEPLSSRLSNAGLTFGFGRFENAVTWGAFHSLTPEPVVPTSLDVFYFRPVSGLVEDVRAGRESILLDGQDYWGAIGAFATLQAGARIEGLPLAGPANSDPVTRPACATK